MFHFRGSQKKEDWNAIVRQNTIKGDPIGSTSEVVERRKRQSLKRQIIAQSNEGLQMNTDQLLGNSGNVMHFHISYLTFINFIRFKNLIPSLERWLIRLV